MLLSAHGPTCMIKIASARWEKTWEIASTASMYWCLHDHSVISISMEYCQYLTNSYEFQFCHGILICRFSRMKLRKSMCTSLLFSPIAIEVLKAGKRNAKVLPLPVAAMPITSSRESTGKLRAKVRIHPQSTPPLGPVPVPVLPMTC